MTWMLSPAEMRVWVSLVLLVPGMNMSVWDKQVSSFTEQDFIYINTVHPHRDTFR